MRPMKIISDTVGLLFLMGGVSIAQWTQVASNGARSIVSCGGRLFAGAEGVFVSSDSNRSTWSLFGLQTISITSLVATDSFLFAGTNSIPGGIYQSAIGSSVWTPSGSTNNYFGSFLVHGADVFAGSIFTGGGIYVTTDNGRNWLKVNANPIYDFGAFAFKEPNLLFAAAYREGSGVFLSTNNGSDWSGANTGLPPYSVLALAVKDSFLFAGTIGDGVFRSSNNGTSWTSVNAGLTIPKVTSLAVSGNFVFAATDAGIFDPSDVFLSTDNGSNWSNTNLWVIGIRTLAVEVPYLFAGSGRGVYRRSISQMTSLPAFDHPQVPSHAELDQNFPDPFNPETVISYAIAGEGRQSSRQETGGQAVISIRVYDLLGREMAVLVNEEKMPGTYSVTWGANGMASGVYFYRLQTDGNVFTKKMILLR